MSASNDQRDPAASHDGSSTKRRRASAQQVREACDRLTSTTGIRPAFDHDGGTFTLKSKLRIGTDVVITFPSERVMAALAPLAEPAPSIQAQTVPPEALSPPPPTRAQALRRLLRLGG